MNRYALIDSNSGFVWGVTDAAGPLSACRQVDSDVGGRGACSYRIALGADVTTGPDVGFYAVYAVPQNFDVDDGQDPDQIAAVEQHGPAVAWVAVSQESGQ
jgi:hypothetical protein